MKRPVEYVESAIPEPWSTARSDGQPEPCVCISDLFMQLIPACGISWGAGATYIVMVLESKGADEVFFPPRVARRYGISKTDLSIYIKELTRGGYVRQTGKFHGHPHIYTLPSDASCEESEDEQE